MAGSEHPEAAPLAPETVLVRAREVLLRLSDADEVSLDLGSERVVVARAALAILDRFASPRRIGEVIAEVGGASASERAAEITTCIRDLERNGVLLAPGKRGPAMARGWMKPSIHLSMLDDRARTSGFCHALQQMVRPDDVVVDIGTGTGVLATCAALAGARHVFALESSGMSEVAARLFARNGVEDRVTLIRERSTTASLPERGTLLVTETIGNDPLDEETLELVADAKKRLLVPGARIIPSALEFYAIAVDVPRTVLERHVFTPRKLDAYRAAYGIDFSSLGGHRLSSSDPIMLEGKDVATWPLAPPLLLASIDLTSDYETVLSKQGLIEISRETLHLGILLAFRATLAPGVTLSTLPDECDPTNHWAHALFPAFDCPVVERGTSILVDYSYERGTTRVRISRE